MSGNPYGTNVQRYHLWAPDTKEYVRVLEPTTKKPAAFTASQTQAGVSVYGQVYDNAYLARLVKLGELEVIPCGQSQNQQRSMYE